MIAHDQNVNILSHWRLIVKMHTVNFNTLHCCDKEDKNFTYMIA